ncbi:hypothetical protein [Wolbachia endosymbiont of Cantharis cryptica]|uniref:hypothetical protein n=1 Tax=Wolbachia endosymbiont of Cantharis cryptica TaxID=3066132 RepID=UPI00376EDF7E
MAERNSAIKLIKSYGEDDIKKWKKEMSYGKRSYIEGFFSRLKKTFGFRGCPQTSKSSIFPT